MPNRPEMRGDLMIRHVDDEIVAYDPMTDRTSLLNLTAGAILDACDGTRTVAEIAAEVARLFSVKPEEILDQVQESVERFANEGLFAPESPFNTAHRA